MTESEAIKKAIRYFECMKNDAVVVLDSGFGTHPGESDLVYRNRKMYAELAINALEKQIPKKPIRNDKCTCPSCGTHNEVFKRRRNTVAHDIVYCWHCGQAVEIDRLE